MTKVHHSAGGDCFTLKSFFSKRLFLPLFLFGVVFVSPLVGFEASSETPRFSSFEVGVALALEDTSLVIVSGVPSKHASLVNSGKERKFSLLSAAVGFIHSTASFLQDCARGMYRVVSGLIDRSSHFFSRSSLKSDAVISELSSRATSLEASVVVANPPVPTPPPSGAGSSFQSKPAER